MLNRQTIVALIGAVAGAVLLGPATAASSKSHAAGTHFLGSVTAINGDVVTIRTSRGMTRSFTLSPDQVAQLDEGEHIVVFTNGATVRQVEPATISYHGVIARLASNATTHKTTVVVRLTNGSLNTITLANEAAENMLLRKGEPVIVTTSPALLMPPTITVISPK